MWNAEYYVPDTIFVYAISCSSLALEKAVTQLVCPPLLQTTAFQTIGSFAEKFCQERISAIIWLFLQGHQWVNILVYPAQFVYINKMDWHKWKTSAGVELKKVSLPDPCSLILIPAWGQQLQATWVTTSITHPNLNLWTIRIKLLYILGNLGHTEVFILWNEKDLISGSVSLMLTLIELDA